MTHLVYAKILRELSYSSFLCCVRLIKVCILGQQNINNQFYMFLKENENDIKDNKFIYIYVSFY